MFKRRNKRNWAQRIREFFVPSVGYRRSVRYIVSRILRLSGTPHAIAAGVAAGTFASFTPLVGFHFLLSFVVAFLIRGNMLAAALGTAVGNPLTFPFIWASSYRVGSVILGERARPRDPTLHEGLFASSFDTLWPVLKPMLVGGVPLGIAFGLILYAMTYFAVAGFQKARRVRLAERARQRAAELIETTRLGQGHSDNG